MYFITIVAMMSLFMFGCGKADEVSAPEELQKETEKSITAETKEEESQEQKTDEAERTEEQQELSSVEVEDEEIQEEALANEIIINSDPIDEWVRSFEEENLKYIIYNDVQGYKQILNDGETYHMKKDDKIFLYRPMGVVLECKVLTPDVPAGTGNEFNTVKGYSVDILWKDKDVVTYGEQLTMKGIDEPMSITCTFYKATE